MRNHIPTVMALVIAFSVISAAYYYRERENAPTPIPVPIKVTPDTTTTMKEPAVIEIPQVNKEVGKVLLSSTKLREIENEDTASGLTFTLYEDVYARLFENTLPGGLATTSEQRLQMEGRYNFTLATSTKNKFCQFPENKTHIGFSPLRTYVWLSRTCYEGIVTSVFEISTGKKVEEGSDLEFAWNEDESVLLRVVYSSPFTSQDSTDFYVSKTGQFEDLALVFRLEGEEFFMRDVSVDSTSFSFDLGKYVDGVFVKVKHYKYSLEGQELLNG